MHSYFGNVLKLKVSRMFGQLFIPFLKYLRVYIYPLKIAIRGYCNQRNFFVFAFTPSLLRSQMVRKYIKKRPVASYSEADVQKALAQVESNVNSVRKIAEKFGIPYQTLYCRYVGTRGKKRIGRGRTTVLSKEHEESLANGLRLFEKWGFGLMRFEIFDIVQNFVLRSDLLDKVPFKDGMPGEVWFLGFKKRHRLSVKKPQPVEYARKKVLDPFLIYGYFDNLEKSIRDLGLENKPHRIWNLDETSFCTDPSRCKVVGAVNKPATRTISGSGKDNTTVLFSCNAAGEKAPPLIVVYRVR